MSDEEEPPESPPSGSGKSAQPDFRSMAKRLASLNPDFGPVVNGLAEARKRSEEQRLNLANRLAAPPRSLAEGLRMPVPTQIPNISLEGLEHPSIETNRQIRALRTEMEAAREHLGSVAEHQQKQVELVDTLLEAFVAAAATAQSGAEESKEIALASKKTAASGVRIAKWALWAALALGAAQIIVAALPYLVDSPEPKPLVPAPPGARVAPAPIPPANSPKPIATGAQPTPPPPARTPQAAPKSVR